MVGRAFVVIDTVDGVVRASPAAYAYGLVRGHTVVHEELLELAAKVRRDGVILERLLNCRAARWAREPSWSRCGRP